MAHDLLIENGKASMMYVGDPPWHRLGTKLDGPATAAEAIEASGLDWAVSKIPLQAKGNGHTIPVPGKYATMRADRIGEKDSPVFGVVGKNYTPLQNREAFRVLDPIVGEGAAVYHTAGALGKVCVLLILCSLCLTGCKTVREDGSYTMSIFGMTYLDSNEPPPDYTYDTVSYRPTYSYRNGVKVFRGWKKVTRTHGGKLD